MPHIQYVDCKRAPQGRNLVEWINTFSILGFTADYFSSFESLPVELGDLLIVNHPHIREGAVAHLQEIVRQHPDLMVIVTRTLDFPDDLTRDPDKRNLYYLAHYMLTERETYRQILAIMRSAP